MGPLTSALSALLGSDGPYFTVQGLTVPFVNQSSAAPYSQQWLFATQFQIAKNTMVQLSYNGLKGTHVISVFAPQQNLPSLDTLKDLITRSVNLTAATPNTYGIVLRGSLLSATNLQKAAPYQNFFNQALAESYNRAGNSSYHGMYASVTHRYAFGLSLVGSFTWSKSIDNVGGDNNTQNFTASWATVQNPYDLRGERAVSSFDVPAKLTTGYSYQLPVGRGKLLGIQNRVLDTIIGGWTTAGIFNMQSGFPFQPLLGSTGYWFSTAGGNVFPASIGNYERPDIVPGQPCITSDWREDPLNKSYINPAVFSMPGSLNNPKFGNAPRTMPGCRTPRMLALDASISKRFRFTRSEKTYLELRANASNALNHPIYYLSSATSTHYVYNAFNSASLTNPSVPAFTSNPGFGLSTPAGVRNMQLSLKLYW